MVSLDKVIENGAVETKPFEETFTREAKTFTLRSVDGREIRNLPPDIGVRVCDPKILSQLSVKR